MSKESKDNLEQFFRKAVAKHDLQFREKDWEKMEKMLDQDPLQRKAILLQKRRKIVYSLVGVAGLFIGIYFFSFRSSEDISRAIATESTEQKQAAEDPKALGQNHSNDNPSASLLFESESKPATGDRKSQADVSENSKGQKAESEKLQAAEKRILKPTEPDITAIQMGDRTSEAKEDEVLPGREIDRSEMIVSEKPPRDLNENIFPGDVNKIKQPSLISEKSSEPLRTEAVVKADSIQQDDAATVKPEEETKHAVAELKDKTKKTSYRPKWSVALVVAPDFSSIGMGKFSTPGKSYGILGSYRISNRLQVSTGLILSDKKYTGYGEDYQPPEGYWKYYTNGVVPEEVDGACDVLELPVVIQYDVYHASRGRYFLSAGISSYWMLSESYWYTFKDPNPGASESWNAKSSSSYPFGIGNVSIGYERFLGKRVAIGIEPYLKIPLSGVGWCDIDLFSTGANVSLRYSLPGK